ncbi:MAG TPA: adenylate/guanylate cyclase domain-containing protein [Solirubrobacteraceae bacterium]|nr:adenylate/guanylate cyclase domain-containing protein [Solirubrobacteraceae bacterium]
MRRRAWQRRKRLLLAAVTTVTVALGLAAYATDLFYPLEAQSLNTRFSIRGTQPSLAKKFVIVQVDQPTFNYFANRGMPANWPFPRRYHAKVIDNLLAAGAKLIAFDVSFTQQTDAYDDNALIEAIDRAHNMVLATTAVTKGGQTGVIGGQQEQQAVGATVGDALVIADSAGVIRDFQHTYQGIDTFPVAIATRAAGHAISTNLFGGATARVPIDYPGPPGTVADLPYWEVWANHFPPSAVRGKVVIVGAEASILQDVHPTPTSGSEVMDGPEIQADSAATTLAGLPLRFAGGWLNVLVIILFAALTPLLSIILRLSLTMLVSLVMAALFTVGTQIAFDNGTILTYTYPLLAMVLAIIATLTIVLLGEAFERQHARDIFARFVPPGVVDEVLARTDDDFRLGGVERDCTVLFSDLRGFTSFSESQPAAKVIEVVNYYLNEMTEAILAAGGTLISYMGDGIMAVFGAPIDQPDNADRALHASREMIGPRLRRFNDWLLGQGYESGFRMGIGLNSGTVMAGNVGAEQRVEYTAIGDTTNTASRLEGMTKGTPHMLFVSESTRERLQVVPDDMVFVDHFEIRGRVAKMAVYSLPDPVYDEPETALATDSGEHAGGGE